MSLWHQLREVFREMPRFYADKFDHWIADMHRPDADDSARVCRGCRKPWPCVDFMDARERIADRADRRAR